MLPSRVEVTEALRLDLRTADEVNEDFLKAHPHLYGGELGDRDFSPSLQIKIEIKIRRWWRLERARKMFTRSIWRPQLYSLPSG